MSRKDRLRAYDLILDRYKPYVNCLNPIPCQECPQEHNCKIIATRKKMGIENPWEKAWRKKKA